MPLSTYRDGVLLRARNGTTIYVMENGRRRAIPDEATFRARGWRFENVIIISDEELNRIPSGPDIHPGCGYPRYSWGVWGLIKSLVNGNLPFYNTGL